MPQQRAGGDARNRRPSRILRNESRPVRMRRVATKGRQAPRLVLITKDLEEP